MVLVDLLLKQTDLFCNCIYFWFWYLTYSFFRDGEKPKNPMVELFYGRFLAVGVLEGIALE